MSEPEETMECDECGRIFPASELNENFTCDDCAELEEEAFGEDNPD